MSLKKRPPISTAPGGPYADKGTPTEYQASRGGWFPAEDKPVPGDDRTDQGRSSGLRSEGRR
ncbi:hypothetical protein ACF073_40810 [Streptomyces sp. NPDC015171]|uniref:hypothetical protein n=1 Tax=Streptomyces sp. NPDC015171 TaxID=3364945 RepID=UPI0036F9B05F